MLDKPGETSVMSERSAPSGWLVTARSPPSTHPEEGNDVVLGYGLQQPRGPGEALQAGPAGREEGPHHNDPRRGPRQGAHHQVLVHRVAVPAERDTQTFVFRAVFYTHVCSFGSVLSHHLNIIK